MPKASPLQSDFSGGEFSPLVYGRVETELYQTGLKVCKNYIPTQQGGLLRRPGTMFVAEVKDSTKTTRLVEFEFSTEQAYILEFGEYYIRFYKDHGQIQTGGVAYEVSTPYAEADLFNLKFAQSADVLYISHKEYAPRMLSRIADDAWFLHKIPLADGPYLPVNTTSSTLGVTYGTAFTATSISYSTKSISIAAQDTDPRSVAFASAGAQMYVLGGANDKVYRYAVGTPFDLSTAAYATDSYTIPGAGVEAYGLVVDESGGWFMIMRQDTQIVEKYTLSTPHDLSTASLDSQSDALTTIDATPTYFTISSDGTKLYFVGDTSNFLYEMEFGTAYDVTTLKVTGASVELNAAVTGLAIDKFGRYLLLVGQDGTATTITQYEFADDFALFTVLRESISTKSVSAQEGTQVNGIAIALDDTASGTGYFYIVGSSTDTVFQYDPVGMFPVLSGTASTIINDGAGFSSADYGRPVRIDAATGGWGWGRILGLAPTGGVYFHVKTTINPVTAVPDWRIGAWCEVTGYPSAITFHENRLVMGGNTTEPQRFDGSYTGDYYTYSPSETDGSVTDAHAYSFTLNATKVNSIHWMDSHEKGLLIGTSGAVWIVRPSVLGEALSPLNVSAKRSSQYGSADIPAAIVGGSTLYLQRAGRILRDVQYTYEGDGFDAINRTVVAEHITMGGITEISYQAEPHNIIWMVRTDGVLVGFIHSGDGQDIRLAAHQHVLGGVGSASGGDPLVESAASIPAPTLNRDETWVIVKRYINGATVRYIEYLAAPFDDMINIADAHCLDSALKYDSTPATIISGLSHLEGETVSVLADGAAHQDVTVSSGSITLQYAASVVLVGYAYNSDGQILRPEAGAADGTALGKTRRTHRVGLLLHRTLGLSVGADFDNLHTVVFRKTNDLSGVPPTLYSGIVTEHLDADYDFDNTLCWRQNTAHPGMILAVMPQLHTQDR